jgi:hypothetical protein
MNIKGKQLNYRDPDNPGNPYQWHQVVLNLPASPNYDATRPWVWKRRKDRKLASDTSCYVYDVRHMGHNKCTCWSTTQCFCSNKGWLGMKDALRKQTEPTLTPGPTVGSVLHTDGKVLITLSPEKWANAQACILELISVTSHDSLLQKLCLGQIRGFLIYVFPTYVWVTPSQGVTSHHQWVEGRERP